MDTHVCCVLPHHCCCLQDNDPLDVLVVMQSQVAPFSLMQVRQQQQQHASIHTFAAQTTCCAKPTAMYAGSSAAVVSTDVQVLLLQGIIPLEVATSFWLLATLLLIFLLLPLLLSC
jgi:hypothetical protein